MLDALVAYGYLLQLLLDILQLFLELFLSGCATRVLGGVASSWNRRHGELWSIKTIRIQVHYGFFKASSTPHLIMDTVNGSYYFTPHFADTGSRSDQSDLHLGWTAAASSTHVIGPKFNRTYSLKITRCH